MLKGRCAIYEKGMQELVERTMTAALVGEWALMRVPLRKYVQVLKLIL